MEKILAKAEETIVMKHALKNTTAVLRGLAAGNWTDIASLLSGAYAEVSSISSLLLGVDIGWYLSVFSSRNSREKIPKLEFWFGMKYTENLNFHPKFRGITIWFGF